MPPQRAVLTSCLAAGTGFGGTHHFDFGCQLATSSMMRQVAEPVNCFGCQSATSSRTLELGGGAIDCPHQEGSASAFWHQGTVPHQEGSASAFRLMKRCHISSEVLQHLGSGNGATSRGQCFSILACETVPKCHIMIKRAVLQHFSLRNGAQAPHQEGSASAFWLAK